MKIGLVGEAPNDTSAVQNLLSREYPELEFTPMLNRINGSMLDNKKAIRRLLRLEYEAQAPDVVIFIRDLDGLESDKTAKRKRQETFTYSNSIVNHSGIQLLNIFEIEALILADIDIFNKQYGCNLENIGDPMLIAMPKELLIEASKYKFDESHNPDIFRLLRFDKLMDNCRYFSAFVKKLDKKVVA